MKNIVIAIQARSTSTRLPGKCFLKIGDKEILQHVIDSAQESATYINQYTHKNNYKCSVMLLVPINDEILKRYRNKCIIFEGDEKDVLSRYIAMANEVDPDYIVRLTADCPLIPSYVISKHINIAINSNYDYVSNVDEIVRTCVDGHDVEVISKRALKWIAENAVLEQDREHVTTIIRKVVPPHYFRIGHVIGHLYQSHIKLSIDTAEDYERIKREYEKVKRCIDNAIKKNGDKSIYRI